MTGDGKALAAYWAENRGHGATGEQLLENLRYRPMRFMEIVYALEITKAHAMNLLLRQMRYGNIERVSRGLYRITGGTP